MLNWLEIVGLLAVLWIGNAVLGTVYRLFFRSIDLDRYRKKDEDGWAVITGASDGIGLGYARLLAQHRFNVMLVGRNGDKLGRVAGDLGLEFKGIKIEYCVSNAEDPEPSVDKVVQAMEGRDIAILINNVGIAQTPGRLEGVARDELRRLVTVNCTYPMLLTHALLPAIKSRKHPGAIINMSSVVALIQVPFNSVYAASKAFNRLFSVSLAGECAEYGIDVLSVTPGLVASKLSGVKESGGFACNPLECAEGALKQIGLVEAIPHWRHEARLLILRALTQWLVPLTWQPTINARLFKRIGAARYGKEKL